MKKINIDVSIKILILLGFSLFYFSIVKNGQVMLYVHPRIIPFINFSIIAMILIAIFMIKNIFKINKKKIKVRNYLIYIIPLVLTCFMHATVANSSTIKSNGSNISQKSNAQVNGNGDLTGVSTNSSNNNQGNDLNNSSLGFDLYEGKTVSNADGEENKTHLDIENDTIIVRSDNFVSSLDEIIGNTDKYVGKDIEITGFVYKDESLKENEFIVGRFMMVCCAADMQIAGIRCENSNKESYDNDTWVKVKGKIKNDTYEDTPDPAIVIENIDKDPNPDTSYVYPF